VTEDSYPQSLQPVSTAEAIRFHENRLWQHNQSRLQEAECSSDCFRKFDSIRK